jgi:polysaccharide biosynthesis transport protein
MIAAEVAVSSDLVRTRDGGDLARPPATRQLTLGRPLTLPSSAAGARSGDIYQRAFAALRGRIVLSAALGMLCAAVGAFLGWRQGKPQYQSEGLVRIAYSRPILLRETDQNRPMAMYDAFMRSQMLLINSRRMVDMALHRDVWRVTGCGDSPAVIAHFAAELKVERPKETENLRITFTDEDPKIAAAAVNAIIDAYESNYKSSDGDLQQKRISLLEELERDHKRALDDLTRRLAALNGVGTVDVEQMHAAAVQRLAQYEGRLSDIELGLALAQSSGPSETSKTTKTLTVKQIAMMDAQMRVLLADQTKLEGDLETMQLRLGSEHASVIALKKQIQQAKARVEQYAADFREYQAQLAQSGEGLRSSAMSMFMQPVETLRANREVLTKMVEQARQEVASLSSRREEADAIKAQIAKARQALSEVQDRKGMLSLELELGDRLEVTSRAEVPLAPSRDTRLRMAGAGSFAGLILPALLIAAFGTVNRRYRFSD